MGSGIWSAKYRGCVAMRFSSELELAEMYVIARSREEGLEDEGFGSSRPEFEIAIDADISNAGLGSTVRRVEEVLGVSDGGIRVVPTIEQAFGCIGADELGPVAGEEVGIREDVGPHDLTPDCDNDTDGVFLPELAENLLTRLRNWRGGLINLGAH